MVGQSLCAPSEIPVCMHLRYIDKLDLQGIHVLRGIWKMSSADFSHLACRGQKLIVGILPRDGDPVTIVRWQIPQVPGVKRFMIIFLLTSHSLPPVCHAPVWVLDIVAVSVVCAILAGLAREVHLDGADVSEQGAPDIGSW